MGFRHHLTPKFYLALFTAGGQADSRLFVIDKNTGKTFWATPATTGYECDFYTAEGTGPANTDDQFVERFFDERVERPAAPVIRSVLETTTIPERGTMEYARLMGFLASSFVRGHVGWNLTSAVADYTGRAHARELLETPGEWEKMLAEEGIPYEPDGATGIPAMLESINDVTFGMNKNARLKIIMEGIVPLTLRLMEYRQCR